MDWTSPVPLSAEDDTGTAWQVRRAWADKAPGCYLLEVLTPGGRGVRGARLHHGRFELIPLDDPALPALRAEAQQGELFAYRPYRRAVVRAEGRYIKIFRPGSAAVPAERCAQMDILLDAGTFTTPRMVSRKSEDVLVFSAVPGPTLSELGTKEAAVSEETFANAWEKWSRAWVAQLTRPLGPAAQSVFDTLPPYPADREAAEVEGALDRWWRHHGHIPEMSFQHAALRAAAERVTADLLRTAPDPLVWAHGGLHAKQIIVTGGDTPLGLLDFDSTARAEAARDLADLDVHLELRLRENRMAPARYRTAHTQLLAVAEELRVSPARFAAYSDARWLRLALSPLRGRLSVAVAVLAERAKQHRGMS